MNWVLKPLYKTRLANWHQIHRNEDQKIELISIKNIVRGEFKRKPNSIYSGFAFGILMKRCDSASRLDCGIFCLI